MIVDLSGSNSQPHESVHFLPHTDVTFHGQTETHGAASPQIPTAAEIYPCISATRSLQWQTYATGLISISRFSHPRTLAAAWRRHNEHSDSWRQALWSYVVRSEQGSQCTLRVTFVFGRTLLAAHCICASAPSRSLYLGPHFLTSWSRPSIF